MFISNDRKINKIIQHAASVAAMFLTTEAVIATIPEENAGGMPDMGGMGGGMAGMM